MNHWLRYLLWTLMAMFAVDGLAKDETKEREDTKSIKDWLAKTTLPKFELRNQTLAESVAYLNRIIEAQPKHPKGSRIVVATEEEARKIALRRIKPASSVPNPPPPADPKVLAQPPADTSLTFSLTNIPLLEALKYIEGLSKTKTRFQGQTITLCKGDDDSTVDPLVTIEFRVPKDLFPLPTDKPNQWVECMDFFEKLGIPFYEGGFAKWHAGMGQLRLRSTEQALSPFINEGVRPRAR